jgi:hypothetical protein
MACCALLAEGVASFIGVVCVINGSSNASRASPDSVRRARQNISKAIKYLMAKATEGKEARITPPSLGMFLQSVDG